MSPLKKAKMSTDKASVKEVVQVRILYYLLFSAGVRYIYTLLNCDIGVQY